MKKAINLRVFLKNICEIISIIQFLFFNHKFQLIKKKNNFHKFQLINFHNYSLNWTIFGKKQFSSLEKQIFRESSGFFGRSVGSKTSNQDFQLQLQQSTCNLCAKSTLPHSTPHRRKKNGQHKSCHCLHGEEIFHILPTPLTYNWRLTNYNLNMHFSSSALVSVPIFVCITNNIWFLWGACRASILMCLCVVYWLWTDCGGRRKPKM